MAVTRTRKKSAARRIDKLLFEAGNQCAKRLYLEAHGERPDDSDDGDRKALTDIGRTIVELARQAFPRGVMIDNSDFDAAVQRTSEELTAKRPAILFDACFRGEQTEAETDIAIASGDGVLDIFEVKAGTTVKQRHLFDVALQIYTIESAGYQVNHASILHLDPRYRHAGGQTHPVQQLFRNVDVTTRVRRLVERVEARVKRLLALVEESENLQLPTGTWCRHPLPCPYLERCVDEGPEQPLIFLPELTHKQECQLHEDAIEDMSQLQPDREGLTIGQRRALKSLHSNERVVEPFVAEELRNVDFPLRFVWMQWHMDVLPSFAGQRPWQKLPFQWSMQTLDKDGNVKTDSFVATSADDPRHSCIESLADAAGTTGTLIVFQPEFDGRIRSLLDDDSDLKAHIRALMNAPLLDLADLIQNAVYAPGFDGQFDLLTVYEALLGKPLTKGLEIRTEVDASEALRRILNSRTRAKTRDKLGAALTERGNALCAGMLEIYSTLRD